MDAIVFDNGSSRFFPAIFCVCMILLVLTAAYLFLSGKLAGTRYARLGGLRVFLGVLVVIPIFLLILSSLYDNFLSLAIEGRAIKLQYLFPRGTVELDADQVRSMKILGSDESSQRFCIQTTDGEWYRSAWSNAEAATTAAGDVEELTGKKLEDY